MIRKDVLVGSLAYRIEIPEQCPICHHYGETKSIKIEEVNEGTQVQVVFQCAYSNCNSFFIGYYGPKGEGTIISLKPIKPNPTPFPESIAILSPTFIKVFLEAEEAFQLGLGQISGPGYRKAFEFLVKDYAKSLFPDKVAQIEKAFSATVVSEYITDPRIQSVAKRTLWLANDEAHYLRKWETHDIEDLKTLIRLAVNWIDIDQLTKGYNGSMPD